MVGDFSSDAFAHNELLAEHLASWAVLGTVALVMVSILLLS